MVLFWWTGRGYLTAIIVLAMMIVFALILQAAQPLIPDRLWFWGLSFVAAAAVNWKVGSKVNSKRISKLRNPMLRQRLFYRAGNGFMSMPMETFSIVIASIGICLAIYDLALRHP